MIAPRLLERDGDAIGQQIAALDRAHDRGLIDDAQYQRELALLLQRPPRVITKRS